MWLSILLNAYASTKKYYFHKKLEENALLISKNNKQTLIIHDILETQFETNLHLFAFPAVPAYYGVEDAAVFNYLSYITSTRIADNFSSVFDLQKALIISNKIYPYTATHPYNFYVLLPSDKEEFMEWLTNSGLHIITEKKLENIEKHFSSDEPLIAITFNKKIETFSSTTPIKTIFDGNNPKYPLSLHYEDSPAKLNLYIISERAFTVKGFSNQFCDVFYTSSFKKRLIQFFDKSVIKNPLPLKGKYSGIRIENDLLSPYVWDGCIISLITGELPPLTKHKNHISLEPIQFKPIKQIFLSPCMAITFTVMTFFLTLTIGTIFIKITSKYTEKNLLLIYLSVVVVVSAIIAFCLYDTIPKWQL